MRSTAPLAITFAEALFEEQREQNRKVKTTFEDQISRRGVVFLDALASLIGELVIELLRLLELEHDIVSDCLNSFNKQCQEYQQYQPFQQSQQCYIALLFHILRCFFIRFFPQVFWTFINSFLCELLCRRQSDIDKKADCNQRFCQTKD